MTAAMTEPSPAAPPRFVLECPKCEGKFNLKKYVPDKKVRCRRCRAIVKIPIVDAYLTEDQRRQFADAKPLAPEMQAKLVKVFSLRRLVGMTALMVVLLAGGLYIFWMKMERPAAPAAAKRKDEKKITAEWMATHASTFDFPMGRGFEWAYVIGPADGGTAPRQEEHKVIAQSGGPDDPPQFELAIAGPSGARKQMIRIDNAGVFVLAEERGADRFTFEPPLPVMKFPMLPGEVWAYGGQFGRTGGGTEVWDLEFRVTTEVVESGIGKRECFRVETRGQRGVAKVDETHWYAPGVGLVKRVVREGDKVVEEAKLVRNKQ